MADILKPDAFRKPLPADLVDGDFERCGLGPGIPHTEGSRRVGIKTLRELRDRALVTAAENETLAKRLTEIIGDGDDPKGAA